MNGIIAFVLAGGRVDELGVLTMKRSKAAMPFAGYYRVIDFPLTNLMETGIRHIGVLSQYRPLSLMAHIGTGSSWDYSGIGRTLKILPPYKGLEDSDWYKGTADAIYQNLHFIERHKPEHVLIISGDHIYRMNYSRFLERHIETRAELTMVFKRMMISGKTRYGLAKMNCEGRVVEYREKPENPDSDLVSLTIYAFKTEALIERLKDVEKNGRTFQIYDEIIPQMVEEGRVFGFIFDGFWEYTRTVAQYFAAHQKLLGENPEIDIAKWNVRTNLEDQTAGDAPPAHFHRGAVVKNSIISPGCVIEGEVIDSVLSPWSRVGKGSVVHSSILLHNCEVGKSVHINRAILDKNTRIGDGCRVGGGLKITVIGKNAQIPAGLVIRAGTEIYPDFRAEIPIETSENDLLRNE